MNLNSSHVATCSLRGCIISVDDHVLGAILELSANRVLSGGNGACDTCQRIEHVPDRRLRSAAVETCSRFGLSAIRYLVIDASFTSFESLHICEAHTLCGTSESLRCN